MLKNNNIKKRWKLKKETREKMSLAKIGKKRTLEARKKISEGRLKLKEKRGYINSIESRKKLSESISKEKSHFWKGGISYLPYSVNWTKTLKRSIRERDKYTCQICKKEPSTQVHHIDYNKQNCNPDNLITLCISCHAKTNFNRDYWIKYFHNLMII